MTATPDLEIADCPMCGSSRRIAAYDLPPYAVVRCLDCGLHYLSPRVPEQAMLEAYRSGAYFEGGAVGYASYAEQEAALRSTFGRLRRELVRAGLGGGDLLEIGAGYGFLLEELRPAFRTVTGTDHSPVAAASARARGLDVRVGGLDAVGGDERFDCIIGTHVVEHVYDPRGFVRDAANHLRPGGHLVLATPDMGSFWRRWMGRRWPSFKVPEHVTYLDRDTLRSLLVGAGLVDVRPLPYLHSFPASLIFSKLGVKAAARRLGRLGSIPVPVPATTVASMARRPPSVGQA